ncbi:MAG: single-stranded DNA-binding protein [Chloroflexi bacterium]|nr:MAG: single-stranded DNA-binding protein [Chloroflexota bacterium]
MRQRSYSMFFQVQAFGKVERDPELHIAKDGTPFSEFSLAVTKKRCVEDVTIWLFCYAWGGQAETIKRSVTEGSMLFVQGDFTPHRYTTEDGKQGLSLEVNVEKFSFVDGSKLQGNGQQLCEL